MTQAGCITIFKWGYEGWGNATKLLVQNVDAVERERGHEPPLFVDVRLRRSVRAIGFRDQAFEQQLGPERHRWMRGLGNEAIASGEGGIRIKCPGDAEKLLDLALEAAEANKRIIFFCSCPSPEGAEHCHRTTVAELVESAARRRHVQVAIEEWPGGVPADTAVQRIRIDESELRKVRQGAKTVAVAACEVSTALSALPWGSMVELVSGDDTQIVSGGPLQYRARCWRLPILILPVMAEETVAELMPLVHEMRSTWKLDPLRSYPDEEHSAA